MPKKCSTNNCQKQCVLKIYNMWSGREKFACRSHDFSPQTFFSQFCSKLNCESHVQIAGFVALDSLPMNDTNIFHVTITRPKG